MNETMFIVGASEFVMGVNMKESHVCSQTPSHFIVGYQESFGHGLYRDMDVNLEGSHVCSQISSGVVDKGGYHI